MEWQAAWDGGVGAERCLPLLAVLSHAHPAPVPGGGVAAGSLAHLEADPTGGAAGRPRGPGGPASVPGERKQQRGHGAELAQPIPACPHLQLTSRVRPPPPPPWTAGLRPGREREREP